MCVCVLMPYLSFCVCIDVIFKLVTGNVKISVPEYLVAVGWTSYSI